MESLATEFGSLPLLGTGLGLWDSRCPKLPKAALSFNSCLARTLNLYSSARFLCSALLSLPGPGTTAEKVGKFLLKTLT